MNSPAIGHNTQSVDQAQIVTERLEQDYAEIGRALADALDEARALPTEIENDDQQGAFATVIKKLRDLHGRIEGIRESEKAPYLRGGNAVDSFFGRMKEKLFRKSDRDRPAAVDVLQARVNDYQRRVEAEERRRREEEARAARAEENRLRREREEQERLQREEEARASRARKAENEDAANLRAKAAADEAARLRAQEDLARDARRQAEQDATAKPADLVRTRTESGHMVTAKQVPYVEIADRMLLDKNELWAFFKDDHMLAALKLWAATTQHRKQMPGAIIEMRSKAVIR